ncbi:hypothetical protein LHK17_05115, partial [Staphylococcus argenteus]|nr:hypothetical protein [Staphylococcus argenteus]MCG9845001.1 hypothetical protein [Staphylococcus argenteus]
VLQIAGGGGTFPIQTTPQFFQNISPYLPFTYAIDSLRETVGGDCSGNINYKINYFNVIWYRFLRCRFNFKTCNRSNDETRIRKSRSK